MDPETPLEERVRQLEQSVRDLTTRFESLTSAPGAGPAVERATAAPAAAPPQEASALERWRGVPAAIGRTCLVVGGAFLFRSLTESGAVTNAVGVALGILYALIWLYLADRAAARGEHLSGTFHALASALIVFPLLFEATTRFDLLTPPAAALALTVATALGLAVAWRRDFHSVAWITALAALGVGVLLLFRTRAVLTYTLDLLALGVGSLILAYRRGWRGQRWMVALALDALVLLLGALMLVGEAPPPWLERGAVLTAQIGVLVLYLGAFVLRLLFQGRHVTPFAVVQTALVLLLGFEGSLHVAQGELRGGIAVAALAFASFLHVVLARRSERIWGHGVALAYFASVATFLAAEGVRVLLPGGIYPVVWMLGATLLAALSLAEPRPILQVHAALLTLAAALASGLLRAAFYALAAAAQSPWPEWSVSILAPLALVVTTLVLLERGAEGDSARLLAGAARLTVLVVALVGAGGGLIRLLAGEVAGAPGAGAGPGHLAVLRSAVLAGAAVALAGWRALGGRPELTRLAAGILVLGGLKLAVEDLRVGSAGTLVFSLALYGLALLVAPALMRRGRDAASPSPASD